VAEQPTVKADNREVVRAAFFEIEEALGLDRRASSLRSP
jgi:hypothetical protein